MRNGVGPGIHEERCHPLVVAAEAGSAQRRNTDRRHYRRCQHGDGSILAMGQFRKNSASSASFLRSIGHIGNIDFGL